MNRNEWNPPEPAASDSITTVVLALLGGAAFLGWGVIHIPVRGATRSYELVIEERRAEIDRVVASATESDRDRDGVNE